MIRVNTWDEFKRLAIATHPSSIAYNIEQGIPARHLTSLRLILPIEKVQYVFLDFSRGNSLRKTGIPLHTDKRGNVHIRDEDVKNFITTELKRKDLRVCPYWTI